MAETVSIAPADLLIDEANPRIPQPNAGQHKALHALAQHLGKKLPVLAEDIVRHGLNPSDLPIVSRLAGGNRYVVLEGNRRLAALRALENPEHLLEAVAPNVLRTIRRLSRSYQDNPIDAVTCLVVRDREEARHWIELRHTGMNDGAGIVPWGSDESARFRARSDGAKSEIHLQALDFLQSRGDLTAEARRAVPATSFKRLLETPAVRSRLGVDVQAGVLHPLSDEKRVAKALMYVVNDLASKKTKVGKIYTRAQRVQYANELPADIVVTPSSRSGSALPLYTAGTSLQASKGSSARPLKKRDRLIPRDCVLGIPAGRIRDIEGELRSLSLENHTNAVSVLLRVFIELASDSYVEAHGLNVLEKDPLNKKMEKTVSDLVTRGKLTALQARPVRRACQKDSMLAPSVLMMHQYVHNPHVFPGPSDLRAQWDSLQPFLAAIWAP